MRMFIPSRWIPVVPFMIAPLLMILCIAAVAERPALAADPAPAGAVQPSDGPKGPEVVTSGPASTGGLTAQEQAKLAGAAASASIATDATEPKMQETTTAGDGPPGMTVAERAKLASNPPVEIGLTIQLPAKGVELETVGSAPWALTPAEMVKMEAERAALREAQPAPASTGEPSEITTVGPPDAPTGLTDQEREKIQEMSQPSGTPNAQDTPNPQASPNAQGVPGAVR